jgi:hypothetical protein
VQQVIPELLVIPEQPAIPEQLVIPELMAILEQLEQLVIPEQLEQLAQRSISTVGFGIISIPIQSEMKFYLMPIYILQATMGPDFSRMKTRVNGH